MWRPSAWRSPAVQRVLTVAGGALLASVTICGAQEYTFKTRHTFCTTNCYDGKYPDAGLLMDPSGAVYGTALQGGAYGFGTAFRLTAGNGKITFARLHTFCSKRSCSSGSEPAGVLILDKDGNFYGTTGFGGRGGGGGGVIFKLSHAGSVWTYSVLYSFCSQANCTDGANPQAGLAYQGQSSGAPWDEASPLYGTTSGGGKYNNGAAYEFVKNGSSWTETVIHDFQSSSAPNGLLVDSAGNLFGTAQNGGKYGGGLMFKLANGTWNETVLHNFCNSTNCTDGYGPIGLLVTDASGNLYGTTSAGGTGSHQTCDSNEGCGIVFERTAGGTYSVLYNFCSLSQCSDGYHPGELLMESSGNFLGGSFAGGTGTYNGFTAGVLFELVNNSGRWSETVLHDFCSLSDCADGATPGGGLLLDPSGDIWGVTFNGGKNNGSGTVFELIP